MLDIKNILRYTVAQIASQRLNVFFNVEDANGNNAINNRALNEMINDVLIASIRGDEDGICQSDWYDWVDIKGRQPFFGEKVKPLSHIVGCAIDQATVAG